MNNNPFVDLIPQQGGGANPFADLIPNRHGSPSRAEQPSMSGGDVLSQAVQNFPQSAANLAMNQSQAFMNPVNIGREIGQAGLGAVWEGLKERYGGVENIKRTVATDPAGALADASILVPGIGARRAPALAKSAAMPKAAVRTEAELLKTGGSRMGGAKKSLATVDIKPSLDDFDAKLRAASLRVHPKLHSSAAPVYDEILAKSASPQTLEELHYLRQLADDVAAKPGTEGKIGRMMKSSVDNMIAKHPEGAQFKTGTGEYARAMKSQTVTEALDRAKGSVQYQRGDHAGAIRNAVKPLLNNKQYKKYWTKEERAALRKVQAFSFSEGFGGAVGSTGAMGLTIGRVLETTFGIPPFMLFPAGYAARKSVNFSKVKGLEDVAEMVRAGGPVQSSRFEQLSRALDPSVLAHIAKDAEGAKRVASWVANPTAQTARALASYTSAKLNLPDMAERIISELQGLVPGYAEQEQKQ